MGSVCECCVLAYCSCVGLGRLDDLERQKASQKSLQVGFQQEWELWKRENPVQGCVVHSHCSFCNRPFLGQLERSVKRKFAKVYAVEQQQKQQRQQPPCWALENGEDQGKILKSEEDDRVRMLMDALESEKEAVSALYLELEEERNAAAVAASETLAMIRRLQEEKAAVQMEASQYKRMVEERSEYDQEAIQMLNDILARQEEEKIALSKEVEMYRSSFVADKKRFRSSVAGGDDDQFRTPVEIAARGSNFQRNLMESFSSPSEVGKNPSGKREADLHCSSSGVCSPGTRGAMEVDEEGIHDVYEVSYGRSNRGSSASAASASSSGRDEEFLKKYWRYRDETSSSVRKSFDRLGKPSSSCGLYSSSVSRNENDEELTSRSVVRNGELRELSRRLQALEADRGFLKQSYGGTPRNDDLDILEEISQQLRQIQALERKAKDGKDLSEASFVFSFKGFFSFNGLRQSLNSNINRLACMFLKHTDAAGLNYGDHQHHVGLSHLLENSRKSPRGSLPCLTRGIKVESPPLLPSSNAIHRQNVQWPMDARGRSETAFGGWDY